MKITPHADAGRFMQIFINVPARFSRTADLICSRTTHATPGANILYQLQFDRTLCN